MIPSLVLSVYTSLFSCFVSVFLYISEGFSHNFIRTLAGIGVVAYWRKLHPSLPPPSPHASYSVLPKLYPIFPWSKHFWSRKSQRLLHLKEISLIHIFFLNNFQLSFCFFSFLSSMLFSQLLYFLKDSLPFLSSFIIKKSQVTHTHPCSKCLSSSPCLLLLTSGLSWESESESELPHTL